MIQPWFHKTALDEAFYDEHIRERLPARIIDAHVHMNLPEHVRGVTKERIAMDWALECGLQMEYEAAVHYYSTMLPDKQVELVAFPFPLSEVDIPANNEYLSGLGGAGKIRPLMSVRPEWDAEYVERVLTQGRFYGVKPYPYLASNIKGADISIYDFLPRHQLEVIDRHHMPVVMHLPRKGRLPAPDNIRELREIRQQYPNIRMVLAHFGRCFASHVFLRGMEALGEDVNGFYYDGAAVVNPAIYRLALEHIDTNRILFGTDFPILTWHGVQDWTSDAPKNFAREDFSWNAHEKGAEAESRFTYIAYEQLNNILNEVQDKKMLQRIFYDNANEVFCPPASK